VEALQSTQANEMKKAVLAFIERINAHDVPGIVALMADDYQFVNSSGDKFAGKAFMQDTWAEQFRTIPDFQIAVQRVVADGDGVAVFGASHGTYAPDGLLREEMEFEVPAAFLGIARGGKITYWQVYSDSSIVYDLIRSRAGGMIVAPSRKS
jgi:ketosteroid isomerase-like protein